MTIRTSAARLLGQAIQTMAPTRWILAVAIIGAGLAHLTVASHVCRGAGLVERISTPAIKVIAPPGAASTPPAVGPRNRLASSPALPEMKFRFGFLEFEDDPDASTE